jgi:hypothetical protein
MGAIVERGQLWYDQAQGLNEEPLAFWPILWIFAVIESVASTNNAAERALRPAVLPGERNCRAYGVSANAFIKRILAL